MGSGWVGAGGKDPCDGFLLAPGDPQVVADLYGDLNRHVGTAERLVGWQPAGRVGVALLLVGRPGYSQQFEWVVGHVRADGQAQLLRPGLPGVAEGDDMVDLDGCACALRPS